jgi:hypothetical protein
VRRSRAALLVLHLKTFEYYIHMQGITFLTARIQGPAVILFLAIHGIAASLSWESAA